MADELTMRFQIALGNGDLNDSFAASGLSADQVTPALVRNVQTVPFASHAVVDLADVATPGWAVFQNLDATNFVEVGIDVAAVFYPFIKLEPGEQCMVHLGIAAPYAQADTGAVDLFYIIYNT
jgi:hypothetical protein